MRKSRSGFTIVELLVVIVVIAILAAITIAVFNGIQAKGRDSRRMSDMSAIVKGIKLYSVDKGALMDRSNFSGTYGGWETTIEYPTTFLSALKSQGYVSSVPIDPSNGGGQYGYYFYKYPAGSYGCDTARGDFFVLGVLRTESAHPYPSSPGWSCSGRDWQTEFDWVTGGYTN